MLERLFDGQAEFYNEIMHFVKNKKLSHAYLIESRNLNNKEEIVRNFVRLLSVSATIDGEVEFENLELPSIMEIEANGNYFEIKVDVSVIKKDQILEIQNKFKTKAFDNQYRVYVIYEADKLSRQAANSLLKFLEEPEENIIAILVSDNRYRVLETLRSRCQILSFVNSEFFFDYESIDFYDDFISTLERKKEKTIAYFPIVCKNEYYDKEKWSVIFNHLQIIYEQALRKKYGFPFLNQLDSILNFILEQNGVSCILFKIDIFSRQIERLSFNLNINLMLDDFIIQFSGVGKNG
ncbi:MAG: hypothetical protein PUB18_05840 [bacterium]|nr:hypothetical protein [bacterium]